MTEYAVNPSNPSALHYTDDVVNVEFENEAVFESFKKLEKAVGEERNWERMGYNAYITFAVVTQEDLNNMDDKATCFVNEHGDWVVENGLQSWYATDVWDMISDGAADEENKS